MGMRFCSRIKLAFLYYKVCHHNQPAKIYPEHPVHTNTSN